jgi:hypothetical protein
MGKLSSLNARMEQAFDKCVDLTKREEIKFSASTV